MKETSIVRENLMNVPGYTPYCGSNIPRPPVGNGCDNPRTVFNGEQFICPKCSWISDFPKDFIDRYISKWNDTTNTIFYRPKTRGELRECLKSGIKCEVAANNEEITTLMLNSLNVMKTDNCVVNFKTYTSYNEGWVIYEKTN